jgi:hypothetical protein
LASQYFEIYREAQLAEKQSDNEAKKSLDGNTKKKNRA